MLSTTLWNRCIIMLWDIQCCHVKSFFFISRCIDARYKRLTLWKIFRANGEYLKNSVCCVPCHVQNGKKFRILRCRRNVCLHCGVLKCGVSVLLESCNSEARASSDLHSHFAHNVFPRWRRCRRTESGMLAVCTREPACKIREQAKLVASPSLCLPHLVASPSKDDVIFNCVLCVSFQFSFSFLSCRKINAHVFISL